MANSEDWIECDLSIKAEYFVKETPLSWGFKLWGKKSIYFPKKFMKRLIVDAGEYTFAMPKWYIAEHGIQSLMVDKEMKEYLFPPKRKKRAELSGNLFEPQPTVELLKEPDNIGNGDSAGRLPDWW